MSDQPPLATGPLRYALLALAWGSLGLGLIGVVVPGLPTVPFILLSGWAAMRSSASLNRWLETHRLFGPMILDWRQNQSVNRRAKRMAAISMAACAAVLFFFYYSSKPWVPVIATATMTAVGIWLWRRPEPPNDPTADTTSGGA